MSVNLVRSQINLGAHCSQNMEENMYLKRLCKFESVVNSIITILLVVVVTINILYFSLYEVMNTTICMLELIVMFFVILAKVAISFGKHQCVCDDIINLVSDYFSKDVLDLSAKCRMSYKKNHCIINLSLKTYYNKIDYSGCSVLINNYLKDASIILDKPLIFHLLTNS